MRARPPMSQTVGKRLGFWERKTTPNRRAWWEQAVCDAHQLLVPGGRTRGHRRPTYSPGAHRELEGRARVWRGQAVGKAHRRALTARAWPPWRTPRPVARRGPPDVSRRGLGAPRARPPRAHRTTVGPRVHHALVAQARPLRSMGRARLSQDVDISSEGQDLASSTGPVALFTQTAHIQSTGQGRPCVRDAAEAKGGI